MKNLFDVSGKVAVVTGGSRGIGAMIARGYVENGVRTYISSRKAAVCDAMADELSAYGECISLPNDLASVEGVERFCAEFRERSTSWSTTPAPPGARRSRSSPSRAGTR